MASFICHVVCVTKRLRLERLVRPPHLGTCARCSSPTPVPNITTSLAGERGLARVAGAKKVGSRGQELPPRTARSRLGRSNLAESRACPKPRCFRAERRRRPPRVRSANAVGERDGLSRLDLATDSAGNKA